MKDLSFIALLKGNQINYEDLKSRNLINSYKNHKMTKFTETEFIFSKSKEMAKKIIENLKNNEIKNDVMEIIYKALSYDNTSRLIISKSLNKLYFLGAKEEYYSIIKEYKMVICEEDLRQNGNIYSINDFFIAKNEIEIKNILMNVLNLLIKLYDDDSRKISRRIIKYEKKNEILNILESNEFENYKNLEEFSKIYQKTKFIKKIYFNQPIEYSSNSILYFNKILNIIFDVFLHEDKNNSYFKFKEEKLNQIYNLKGFINNTLLTQLKEKEFSKEMELSIKFFVFAIDCKIKTLYDKYEENFIIKKNDILNKKYVMDFFMKEIFDKKIKICYDKFIIEDEEENESITFEFDKYDKSILNKIIKLKNLNLIKQEKYLNIFLAQFQKENFFSQQEILYMKQLLYHIINSKFFENLIQCYSENNLLPANILKDKNIQEYILNNLIFLPFHERDFDTEAITFNHNAQIVVSGYPYSLPKEYDNTQIYHILELSRKTVEIMHEYIHAIKRYLGICTNGLISSETLDENEDKDEAGYFLEYYVFGWHKMKYSNFRESFPEKGNNNLKNGFFDIPTALNILNQDLYKNDISTIRNILYNK